MRANKYVANATGLSRRAADAAIEQGRVRVNGEPAKPGQDVPASATVTLDSHLLQPSGQTQTIMLNKPPGYVVSRNGQGARTIYDLLPPELHHLKPIGRLDKDSSGLLLLTNDGALAQKLTHPSHQKTKVYEVTLDKPLSRQHFDQITQTGVDIGDENPSKFDLIASNKQQVISKPAAKHTCYFLPATCYWRATLTEGRNRQIRRTFAALGYNVQTLHRTRFGPYSNKNQSLGQHQKL